MLSIHTYIRLAHDGDVMTFHNKTAYKKPNSMSTTLEKSSHVFAQLNEQFRHTMALNDVIQPIFKNHASIDVYVATYEQGVLTIAAENHVAANHLNYLKSIFIDELKKLPELSELESLRFIAVTAPKPKQTQRRKLDAPSGESRRLIGETARMIKDNPELSHALHQLSNKKQTNNSI